MDKIDATIILDINPKSNGHTLIIPKKHYTDYLELDNEIYDHMLEIGKKIQKEIADKLKATGFTFLFNYGDTQEVKHFHLHIIPKYENKTLADPKDIYDLLK